MNQAVNRTECIEREIFLNTNIFPPKSQLFMKHSAIPSINWDLSGFTDGIALPAFGPSAMENWGLIKYRETILLVKEGMTSASSKASTAMVVSHEMAHQVKLFFKTAFARESVLLTATKQHLFTIGHFRVALNPIMKPRLCV